MLLWVFMFMLLLCLFKFVCLRICGFWFEVCLGFIYTVAGVVFFGVGFSDVFVSVLVSKVFSEGLQLVKT